MFKDTENQKISLGDADAFFCNSGKEHPVIIRADAGIDYLTWCNRYKDFVSDALTKHGAILLRGFKIDSADNFNKLFKVFCGEPMEYRNRSSPREHIRNNIYTSTSHPADQLIYMHTENSYGRVFNRIIAFYCLAPAASGGETPIADERALFKYLGSNIVKKFKELGVMYVRNIFDDVGLSWQDIYQTEDKAEVERILDEQGVVYQWISSQQLRLKWRMPAFERHPVTNEDMWFNHMYFGHKSLYNPIVLEFFKESDLPFSTYYGNGSPIEDSVITGISEFYANNSILFQWEKDDMLLLDNMMFSHGRRPFKGDRTILTAMGQPGVRT